MKIAIDIQGFQSDGSRTRGIGRYSFSLIKNLIKFFPDYEYILVANSTLSSVESEFLFLTSDSSLNVSYINWESPSSIDWNLFSSSLNNRSSIILRSFAFSLLKADVILITSFFEGFSDNSVIEFDQSFPLPPIISICYDLIPYLNQSTYLDTNPPYKDFYLKRINLLNSLDYIFAISQSSTDEAKRNLSFDENTAINISSAIDRELFNDTKEELKSEFKDIGKFILYTGAGDPRKNLKNLIIAYSLLPDNIKSIYNLVFAGALNQEEIKLAKSWIIEHNISETNVVFLGYVNDSQLVNLYKNCSLFVFPSIHEGFGLPVLEAMTCGAIAIGSNLTSIPEVIGNESALFDPYDVNSIAKSIYLALADQSFRDQYLTNSRNQINKFSWEITVSKVITVFKSIVKTKNDQLVSSNSEWQFLNERYRLLEKIVISLFNNTKTPNFSNHLSDVMKRRIASSVVLIKKEIFSYFRNNYKFSNNLDWRIEGPFDSTYSLAILNRKFATALNNLKLNVSLFSTEGPGDFLPSQRFLSSNPAINDLYKKSHQPKEFYEVVSRNLYPPRASDMNGVFNIFHSYGWEESRFPENWVRTFNDYLQGITVMSTQVRNVLIASGVKIPINVCPLGVDHIHNIDSSKTFNVSAKEFRFLHISSCFPRKGICELIDAYFSTFQGNDNVSLIIKTFKNPHNDIEAIINKQSKRYIHLPQIIVIDHDLSDAEMKSLYLQSNVLVAPSYGEGFGLPIAEAMSLGIPVITTAWGGQTDFCTNLNSWLIEYTFVNSNSHFEVPNSYWAKPSKKHLISLFKQLYNCSSTQIQQKVLQAKTDINSYTWERNAKQNLNFVQSLSASIKPKKSVIGFLTTYNKRCGIASYSEDLINNIDKIKDQADKIVVFSQHKYEFSNQYQYLVNRCWNEKQYGYDNLSNLTNTVIKAKVSTLIVQFNFGFFNNQEFILFLEELYLHNINVIIIFHSTIFPEDISNSFKINFINTISKAELILVHSITDLNRFKSMQLINNVSLFPHSFASNPYKTINRRAHKIKRYFRFMSKRKFRLASSGFCLPNKGFKELIYAVRDLLKVGIPVTLTLYTPAYNGYEWCLEELNNLISDLNLKSSVSINNLYLEKTFLVKSLSKFDLLVYPYQNSNESSSASVRQGLASGAPVAISPSAIFEDLSDIPLLLPGSTKDLISKGLKDFYLNNTLEDLWYEKGKQRLLDKYIGSQLLSNVSERLYNIVKSVETNTY